MPELPEVETTLQGILPVVSRQTVEHIVIRERRLRWPVPASLPGVLAGQAIRQARRRAKYLLLTTDAGTLIIHLGMSGSLKIVPRDTAPKKHDHVDIQLANGNSLRFHDPRRFGCMLWTGKDPMQHKLLRDLGPEPLADDFNAAYLHNASRGRKTDVKQFIMNSHVVVGVGNIYASEALFIAGINPKIRAGTISLKRYTALADAIKTVLTAAIRQGGTTLRDFVSGEGKPGYFKQQLNVYGREGLACIKCHATVKCIRQGQRSTYYCSRCQR